MVPRQARLLPVLGIVHKCGLERGAVGRPAREGQQVRHLWHENLGLGRSGAVVPGGLPLLLLGGLQGGHHLVAIALGQRPEGEAFKGIAEGGSCLLPREARVLRLGIGIGAGDAQVAAHVELEALQGGGAGEGSWG